MGYGRATPQRRDRLARVLDEDLLGLDDGAFDFRFDSLGFVEALCKALDLSAETIEAGLADLRALVARRRAYAPSMFVETNFKRRNEPLFALSAMESKRWIVFERSFRALPAIKQIHVAGKRTRSHYNEHDGVLPLWGTIQHYVLFLTPETTLLLGIDGRVVESDPAARINTVNLSIGGRRVHHGQLLD